MGSLTPGIKWPGHKTDHYPPSNVKVDNSGAWTRNGSFNSLFSVVLATYHYFCACLPVCLFVLLNDPEYSSETSMNFHQTVQYHIQEHSIYINCHVNLKSQF
jgi:hypothetical protein